MKQQLNNLRNLLKSDKFKEYQKENEKFIILWEKIYWRRKDLWLTQAKLSKLSSIPQNKISQLESWTYWEPWYEIIERLADSLQIDIDYLLSKDITRKTFEVYQYIISKIQSDLDIMQFMKIPYFIDLSYFENFKKILTNFVYIRYNYWPFDKKVYSYQKIFSWKETGFKDFIFTYLQEEDFKIIDWVLKNYPIDNWEKLKKISYETTPMKKLKATLWWKENMWVILAFS